MKAKAIVISAFFFCCFASFGFPCPNCGESMLEEDNFCQNCGKHRGIVASPPSVGSQEQWRPSNYGNRYESSASDGVGERLLGMGRGLATIVLSSLNVVRGMATGCAWIEASGLPNAGGEAMLYCAPVFISVGAAMGSFATCADAINGTLDMVSVGYYGDWLYDSEERGKPTPWIWERKWYASAIPWVDRE